MRTLFVIALLTSPISMTSLGSYVVVSSATLTVPDQYPNIQAAVDAASPGDMIQVAANTYNEHLVINKSLTIVGESKETTVIDGGNINYVINISNTNNVRLAGFTIQNAANTVIYLEKVSNSFISDTIVRNGVESGIYLKGSSNCTFYNNVALINNWGLRLDRYSQNNTIYNNVVRNNTEAGMYLEGAQNNEITRNQVVLNGNYEAGFSAGIYLDYGAASNKISQNNVTANNWHGMYLVFSPSNIIVDNTISKNLRTGVVLSSSNSSLMIENDLSENAAGLQMFGPLNGHVIYRNNFIQNLVQLEQHEAYGIVWDNGAEGNYWSDYTGQDIDGDGVGDTLIPHLGADIRPLMEFWRLHRAFQALVWNNIPYYVTTRSNSTVASFEYNHGLKQVSFNVTGPVGAFSFCNVTIPRSLTRGPWQVLLDEAPITASVLIVSNVSHTALYFSYTLSTHWVRITGTGGLDINPPVANAGPDQTINEDTLMTFDGSSSTDDIGVTSYTWTFTDMTKKTLAGAQTSYIFENPGLFLVTLNVTDVAGNWATDNIAVTVRDVTPPVAEAGSNQTVTLGTTVSFDASSSTDNLEIVSYEWNFGDQTAPSSGKVTSHIYTQVGTYTVTLTVKDAADNTDSDSSAVTVLEAPSQPWIWIAIGIALVVVAAIITYSVVRYRGKKS